jgi:hypothetical protein
MKYVALQEGPWATSSRWLGWCRWKSRPRIPREAGRRRNVSVRASRAALAGVTLALWSLGSAVASEKCPRWAIAAGLAWRGVALEEPAFTLWDVTPIRGEDGKVPLFVGRRP